MAVVEDLLTCDAARLGEVNRGQVPRTIEGGGAPAATAPPSAKWQIQHFGRLALDVEVRCNSAVFDQCGGFVENSTHENGAATQSNRCL